MVAHGRGPAPTALKLLKGTRPDRINFDEPVAKDGLPQCPKGVDPAVRAVWDYTVAELDYMKILAPSDRDALYAYCEAVVLHRRASELLASAPLDAISGNSHVTKHPAVSIQRDAAAIIRSFAHEFGLTPSARSSIRVGGPDSGKKPADAARLLSG